MLQLKNEKPNVPLEPDQNQAKGLSGNSCGFVIWCGVLIYYDSALSCKSSNVMLLMKAI